MPLLNGDVPMTRLAKSAFAACAMAAATGAAADEPQRRPLAAIVAQRVDAAESPTCVAVGLVADAIEVAFACTPGAGPVPARDSIFEIGSITKGLTGFILADMVRKGEVSLDDPASRYSRSGAKLPRFEGREVTLRDLVTQTSSLPRLPPAFAPASMRDPYADFDADALYAALARTTLSRPIGQAAEYSNFGFMWLSEILARRAGMRFDALLAERVLAPLGMTDSAIVLTAEQMKRMVTPHAPVYEPTSPWEFAVELAGVGGLRSPLADMLKLASALAGRRETALDPAIALALRPMRPAELPGNSTGYGWVTLEKPGVRVHWHNGGTGGSHAMIAVNPATRTAAVVLVDSTVSFDDLAFHLVAPVLPMKQKRVALPIDPATRDQYAGTHRLVPDFRIEVYFEGGRMMTRATGQRAIEVSRDGPDTFFTRGIDARLVFHRREDGSIDSLRLHQGGRETPAPKVP